MKLESLTLTNFRCFGPDAATITWQPDLTALVGNNGSGKTAVFLGLLRLFGISASQRRIVKSDFHIPAENDDLASGTMLSLDCILSFPELAADEDDPSVPDVFYHMAASAEGEPLKLRLRLQATWDEDLTPEGSITEEVRWIQSLNDTFDWDSCAKVAAIDRSLIQLIYVPAMRNAFDQVTGLLKGRLWQAAQWSQALHETAEAASASLQEEFDTEEPTEFIIERLSKRWAQVHQGDTDAAPSLRLIESRLEELLQRTEFIFSATNGASVRRLEELSDGQRSLFHIALTAAVLEIEKDALATGAGESHFDQERLKRTALTILAIEEPENSLSPFFLTRIMEQGREIGAMKEAQVMISSHSASILSRVEPEEVRYVRLDEKARRSSVRPLTLPASGTEARKFVRLAVRAYPELYFARYVVLAEGDSEAIVLPSIANAMGFALDRSFVPIVPLGGRFVAHFWRMLTDLKIPYATLIDLDLGRKHGGAKAIASVIEELAAIGNDLSANKYVADGDIDLNLTDEVADAELLDQDQDHAWLRALRREGVYFSSPIDIDFAMLMLFPAAYQQVRSGGQGPQTGAQAVASKKASVLKTGGNPALYGSGYDLEFTWYPYLFLGESKPEAHLRALSEITPADLAAKAPKELKLLINRVRRAVS
ncbi:ATP-dependent nuclease [Novosphingobium sp. KACC 22771]|uniref:ATP-dependent nuclease n=1 Tax=Novosphingobium sp. KACC 22771 TaxID=3025670 RepID=UPI0023650C25|nr:AAA family ATPase [Novosphingobium sp. KACC 22771]WDF73047.1 AAA family ATPase [Novosphingobium sp. KACC 22771]